MNDSLPTIRNRAGTLLVIAEEEKNPRLCIFPTGQRRLLNDEQLDLNSLADTPAGDSEITEPQRKAYYTLDQAADLQRKLDHIDDCRKRHLAGGGEYFSHLAGATLPFDDLVARLEDWLKNSTEATIGSGIGVSSFFFTVLDGVKIGIHADVGGNGVAELLKLVIRAGGSDRIHVAREFLNQPGSVAFKYQGIEPTCPQGFYTSVALQGVLW
jgi:hypothetical protein